MEKAKLRNGIQETKVVLKYLTHFHVDLLVLVLVSCGHSYNDIRFTIGSPASRFISGGGTRQSHIFKWA
jgi:hypothetical protein